jgi:hypothetical protein
MPNAIKYNVSAETLALKKGNFWIGTGDVGKGPTSSTGYYNGITPPSGGYTIYLNKESNGPSIYTVTTEAQMVSLTNTIGAQSFTTSGQCLNWFATQTDKMIFNIDYPAIVTNGLVLNLDAGFTPSYSQSGVTWYDVSSGGNNGTLTNGPTFNSVNGGSIVFDGVDDYAQITSPFGNIDWSARAWSFSAWMKLNSLGDRCLVNLNSANSTDYIVTNVFYSNGGSYWYFIKNSNSTQTNFTTPGGTFTTNEIFYFTMTYNGNGLSTSNINFYKNGTQVTTFTGGSAGLGNMSGLQIGGGNNYPMNGNVYNFLMYNRAISASEVLQNYNSSKGRFGL